MSKRAAGCRAAAGDDDAAGGSGTAADAAADGGGGGALHKAAAAATTASASSIDTLVSSGTGGASSQKKKKRRLLQQQEQEQEHQHAVLPWPPTAGGMLPPLRPPLALAGVAAGLTPAALAAAAAAAAAIATGSGGDDAVAPAPAAAAATPQVPALRPPPPAHLGRGRGAHVDMSQLVRVMALAATAPAGGGGVPDAAAAGAFAALQPAPCGSDGACGSYPDGDAAAAAASRQLGLHTHQQQQPGPCRTDLSGEVLLLSQELSANASAARFGQPAGVTSQRRGPHGAHHNGQQQSQQQQQQASGQQGKPRREPGRFIYGNYHKYYGYRLREGPEGAMQHDGRLRALDPAWLRGRRLLDVGCNSGVVTLAMAMEFGCSRTDGVDIDPVLAGKAVAAAARLREELQRRMRDATSPAKKPPGYDPTLRALARKIKALSRVTFTAANWLEAPCPPGKYEVVTVFSVTKWIHLNWGDEGLARFFRKLHRCLAPGGVLILEPQPWKSYHAAVHKKDTCTVPFRRYNELKLRPDGFADYLTAQVGFELVATLSTTGSGSGGGGGGSGSGGGGKGGGGGIGGGSGGGGHGGGRVVVAGEAPAAAAVDGVAAAAAAAGSDAETELDSLYESLNTSAARRQQEQQRQEGSAATSGPPPRRKQHGQRPAEGAAGGGDGTSSKPPVKPDGFAVRPLLVFRKPLL